MDRQPSANLPNTRKGARRECEGLWDWNLVSNRVHFSPGWISLAGCQDHEVGNTPEEWIKRVHPDDTQQLLSEIEAARADGECEFDLRYRLRHKDGTYRWMSSRGLVVRNDAGEAIRLTGAQVDITVETVTDRLTGLPNRLLLVDRLSQSIARARRHSTFHYAVLLVDPGRPPGAHFKPRADADPLLNAAARRVETSLRMPEALSDLRQNDLVARVEGDLIAILLDGLSDRHHAKAVGDRILAELLNPLTVGGREARLTPTIGIALSATGYASADEALRDAQTALHRARVLGGSHCELFDADVLKSEQSALQLEGDLETALQRGEFHLVYQPIVSLASNEVVGFEALVRWQHPVLGTISPLDFIPLAERSGLIVPLGQWIVQEACLQLKAWQTSVPTARDLWVSVNLSGVQLRDPKIADQIEEAIQRADVEPRGLVLELTEGVAMDNPIAVTTLLMRLRALGVRISIDDFGTGYSSLAYLRQFPVDALKIDQSFVRGIANDKDTAAIVTSIVAMAKELGLYVVAEGVEKDAQLTKLRQLQCESAQGHFFSVPLDPKRAEEYLKTGPSVAASPQSRTFAGDASARVLRLHQWSTHTLSRLSKELLVAGAVLAVIATAGVLMLRHGGQVRPATTPAAPNTSAIPDVPTPGISAAPVEQAYQPPQITTTPAKKMQEKVARSSSAAEPVAGPPQPPADSSAPAAARTTTVAKANDSIRFEIVHLHKVGKCHGELFVSGRGIQFVPDKAESNDGFMLRHGEFVQSLDKDMLIIRSAHRAFRFTVANGSPGERAEAQLEIADTIARSRER